MAEEGKDSNIQLSNQNEQSDRTYTDDTFEFIKKVLDKCLMSILEGLDRSSTEKILDVFREEGTFPVLQVRDLQDTLKNKTTSDCIREMCKGLKKNPTRYVKLKSALVRTGQEKLLEKIETIETAYHDGLKEMQTVSGDCHTTVEDASTAKKRRIETPEETPTLNVYMPTGGSASSTPTLSQDQIKGQTLHGCVCTADRRCPLQDPLKCPEGLLPFGSSKVEALQQHLLAVYKDDCDWDNPVRVAVEEPVTISQMYVSPDITIIKQKRQEPSLNKQQQKQGATEQLNYHQIFYTNKEDCKNIYITANAGMGKTTFCKKVVSTWCKAVQNISEEGDSTEDLSVLKQFRLLFYVNLREAESLYHVEDMIRENLLHDTPIEYNVSDILKTEKCLVVLDGLDEWSCPEGAKICRGLNKDIPGRNTLNKNSAYLTTSRNWKFDVIDLKSKDYDKQVELCGIGENSSKKLAEKTVCRLSQTSQNERPIIDFFDEVEEKNLDTLTNVPVLLIQLITLWYFCKDLGKSQVQLYCRMLDILFEKAKKHLSERSSTVTKPVQTDAELPGCFTEEEDNCRNHTQLLLCLSKLAFMSLLNKKKEDSLVFKSSRLEVCGIDPSDISLCLKCGILTQNKALCYPIGRYKKYSFIHKKLQEFLAAVYLVTSNDVEKNIGQIREYCDKLDTTLEMGQMFMFVCGMNPKVGKQLLEHLRDVMEGDNSLQNNRQSLVGRILIEDTQTCVMACVSEGASNGLTIDVHLQDYYIDNDTISHYINHVVESKNTSIKSVYIDTDNCSKQHVTVVLEHLQTVQRLEKVWLRDPLDVVSHSSILAPLLTTNVSTLQSLVLVDVNLARHEALFAAVLGCVPSLRALGLGGSDEEGGRGLGKVRVTHGQKEKLLAATSRLTQLGLYLDCTDHRARCRPVLDLSGHTQLQKLGLWRMCVTNLHAVALSVEKVWLGYVTIAHSTLRQFIEALEQSSNKSEVWLYGVTVTEDSGDPADMLAYIRDCDKFTVESCYIKQAKTWWVKFHMK